MAGHHARKLAHHAAKVKAKKAKVVKYATLAQIQATANKYMKLVVKKPPRMW